MSRMRFATSSAPALVEINKNQMGKIIKPLGSIDRELSKNEIIELAENHTVQIIEGEYDLLKVYIELKRYQAYLDTIINELKEEAINKAKGTGTEII